MSWSEVKWPDIVSACQVRRPGCMGGLNALLRLIHSRQQAYSRGSLRAIWFEAMKPPQWSPCPLFTISWPTGRGMSNI